MVDVAPNKLEKFTYRELLFAVAAAFGAGLVLFGIFSYLLSARLNEVIDHRIDDKVTGLTSAIDALKKSMSHRLQATYSYSFRFKGSEYVAQRPPVNRLYFYSTKDDEVEVKVYFAKKRFPVDITVDNKRLRPTIYDSKDGLPISRLLVYENLQDMSELSQTSSPIEGAPRKEEDPRPEGVHYIEFKPGIGFTLETLDDYEVSGVLLVKKKEI